MLFLYGNFKPNNGDQMDVRVLKHLMRQSKGRTYGLVNIQCSVYLKPTFLIV